MSLDTSKKEKGDAILRALVSTDPMYNILKFEWGFSMLNEILIGEDKTPFNFYVVMDKTYNDNRKDGRIYAKMKKRSLIREFKTRTLRFENVKYIDYEKDKFIIVTDKDLSDIIEIMPYKITVGATVREENDSIGSLSTRALKALNEANVTKSKIKTL